VSHASSRLESVRERIRLACAASQRDPRDVTLIAVSKTQPIQAIWELYELGQRHFGESRLQEAIPKIESLPKDIVWHFIGPLQSNKAKRVGQHFRAVHTLHKASQLTELAKSATVVDGLIEINVGQEPQKSGILLSELDEFLPIILNCKSVHFQGLMTIGPALDDPEQMRPYFRAVREANVRSGGRWLSMGMSHDFEVALQEGATHIRIGTALFGERD
jgi:PLP dependent protein